MRRTVAVLTVLLSCACSLWADVNLITIPRNYFFPPPKGLYFFRPDLYVKERSYNHFWGRYGYGNPYSWPRAYQYGPLPYSYPPMREPAYYPGGVYRIFVTPVPGGVVSVNTSDIVFKVKPSKALIFVDDKLVGSARDFATERDKFPLLDGEHTLRIESPGYQTFVSDLNIVPSRTLHLEIELQKAKPVSD